MLFVSISFVSGSQRESGFWWNMGYMQCPEIGQHSNTTLKMYLNDACLYFEFTSFEIYNEVDVETKFKLGKCYNLTK